MVRQRGYDTFPCRIALLAALRELYRVMIEQSSQLIPSYLKFVATVETTVVSMCPQHTEEENAAKRQGRMTIAVNYDTIYNITRQRNIANLLV